MRGQFDLLIQICINGLAAGAMYSLVAVGYSLVYGVLRFINFAHAASVAIGAYAFLTLTTYLGMPIVLAFLLASCLAGLFGWTLEKVAYHPLRRSSSLTPLLSGIAIAILVENVLALAFGPAPYRLSRASESDAIQLLGRYSILRVHLYMLASAGIAAMLLLIMLRYSSLGRRIRATAENPELAKVRGIDTDNTISLVFVIGSFLAGVAGILIAYETQVSPQIGFLPSIKGFIAALVGGLGSVGGTMIAGLLLGFFENVLVWQLPTVYKDSIAFVVLIGFLLFKPSGLFPNKWKRF